ncbi:ribosomal protein S5 domain 2-type protein [Boletus edulis BED1]|uniref:Ribosomal RNA-processing protein 43 n=1 Tax=Boletus edulis BED1 TaxID=1328754 RepID=A0AAD4BM65_BOLED|nr:ribosomal protein S5 domain 2-type protein [Boletus edulis BED1]
MSSDALRAQIFQRLHPHAYLDRFLAEGVRPDGRESCAWRDVFVNVGSISTADGSALVRMGKTIVVCGVKAEIAEPELDSPDLGFIVPNIDLPAMCSPKFKPGPPSEEAQVLSERLNDALVRSNILPLDTLCIASGRAAWCLYIDTTCLNYDGNAFDAALVAIMAALGNTTLPQATFDLDTSTTTCSRDVHVPLSLNKIRRVVGLSFGCVGGSTPTLLADPTSFEEPLLTSTVSIVVDVEGGVVSVERGTMGENDGGQGETSASQDTGSLGECILMAKERAVVLHKLFE